MTARALCGLLVLHGMYLAVGGSVLLSLRGWSRWRSAVRLAGLAYLLGVATLGIAWTLLLVVGVPFGPVTIVVSSLVVVGAGLFVRRRRGGVERPPEASSRGSRGLPGLVTVIGIVAAGGYLVALFRVARLNGLFSFDGWAFWVTGQSRVFLRRVRRAGFLGRPAPVLSAGHPDPRRRRVPRDGLGGRRHAPCPVLVPRSGLSPPRRDFSPDGCPPGSCGRGSSSRWSCLACGRACSPPRPTSRSTTSSSRPQSWSRSGSGIGMPGSCRRRGSFSRAGRGTGRWSVVPTVGLAAIVLAAVWGRRSHAVFAGMLVLGLTLAGASTSVVFPEIGVTDDEAVNPIVRLTAGTVLAIACLTPLLLAGAWAGRARDETA